MEEIMDWIDVNKSLPNNKQRVLVYYWCAEDYTKITVGEYFSRSDGEGFWMLDDLNDELFFVTHWQPLPEPPLAEK